MRVCLLAFVLIICSALGATSATVLTLEDCIRTAKEKNPAIRTAENNIKSAHFAQRELATSALPQIRAVFGASYAPYSLDFGYDPAVSSGGEYRGQVVAELPLYDGGIRRLKQQQAGIDLRRLQGLRAGAERDLAYSVRLQFLEVLRAQKLTTLRQIGVSQLQSYLDLVTSLKSGGGASYTDLAKTEIQLSRAKIELQAARESNALAKYSLAELIGLEIDTSFTVSGDLTAPEDQYFQSASGEVDSLVDTGIPIQAARLEYEKSLLDIEITKREQLPTVSLSADVGYVSSRENLQLEAFDRYRSLGYSVGIAAEIPLLDWGGRRLRREQRSLESANLKLEIETRRRAVVGEIRRKFLELNLARLKLTEVAANLVKADDNFVLAQSKYASGAVSALEVLDAQQLSMEVRLEELATMIDIGTAMAALDYLISH